MNTENENNLKLAIVKTLIDNAHLADGDNCTLYDLKQCAIVHNLYNHAECKTCEITLQNRNCSECFYKLRNFENACHNCGVGESIYIDGSSISYPKNNKNPLKNRVPKYKQLLNIWRIK